MFGLKNIFAASEKRILNDSALSCVKTTTRVFGAVLISGFVVGCASKVGPVEPRSSFMPNNHLIRNPIEVGHKTYSVDLMFDEHGNIQHASHVNLKRFLNQYNREGGYGLNAMVASGPYHETAVSYLNNLLTHMGYSGSNLSITPYKGSNPTAMKLYFTSSQVTANAAGCDALSKPMTDNHGSSGSSHDYFGCALRNNIAAMVDDPNDFNQLGQMGEVSIKRRIALYSDYENPGSSEAETTETETTE